jgi:ATPase subunit of ABC transporter with duplicated ATPase domains
MCPGDSFAGQALFDDVSLQVNRGDRIGLVGLNGAGKSTLFALLLGDVSPDKGTIAIEKNATIGFLPQETAAAGDETVLELALAVSPALVHAQKVIKEHEAGHDYEHEHPPSLSYGVAGEADDVAYHKGLHVFDEHRKDRGPTSAGSLSCYLSRNKGGFPRTNDLCC